MASIYSSCKNKPVFGYSLRSFKELFSEESCLYALILWIAVLLGGIPVIFWLQKGKSKRHSSK